MLVFAICLRVIWSCCIGGQLLWCIDTIDNWPQFLMLWVLQTRATHPKSLHLDNVLWYYLPTNKNPNNGKGYAVALPLSGNKIMKVNDLTVEKKETCGHSVHGSSFSPIEIFKENGEDTDSPLLAVSAVKKFIYYYLSTIMGSPPVRTNSSKKKERKSTLHQNEADETSEKKPLSTWMKVDWKDQHFTLV